MPSGLVAAAMRPWLRDAKPISRCRAGFSSGRYARALCEFRGASTIV
jgi:hypothetical protein